LIERSETQWKRKLERQSKTLKAAVREYRRRYKRPPPKHFEIWWDYVTYHDVQLVDEYDSIHARLQPFWGVDPVQLRAAQAEHETFADTFTIGKLHDDDSVVLLNSTLQGSQLGHQRVQDQLELIDEVQEWLPAFRATFTKHDGPLQFVSWEMRKAAVDAAERGEYLDVKHMASQITARGWSAACPPNTPIHDRQFPPPGASNSPSAPPPSAVKLFIYNHRLSMSPCHHPLHLLQSGYLAQYHYSHQFGPSPAHMLAPTFAISTSPLHNDLLSPAPEQWVEQDELGIDPPWADKVDERLLWRGSNTGTLFKEGGDWNTSQRIRLVAMGTRRGGETRVLFPRGEEVDRTSGVGFGENVKWNVLNSAFMDVAFVGNPVQCRGELCGVLQNMFEWRKKQSYTEAWHYKYIMDVDGNGWSARFKRLLSSNSLVLKSTIFPEWYTERIMPWVHYVPVQIDYSDLYDILAFFRGSLSLDGSAEGHDRLAEKIASAGKAWSATFWRKEDMTAYMFRVYLEYARVMSLERNTMNYQDDDEHEQPHHREREREEEFEQRPLAFMG